MAARGTAEWKGDLKGGSGTFTAGDGISGDFSFKTRFEDAPGANPEQLIGAALASCFSMALSNALAMDGHVPESVRTPRPSSRSGRSTAPNSIARIDLTTIGDVPGIDQATFEEYAENARTGCIVSRALAGVPEKNLTATLES